MTVQKSNSLNIGVIAVVLPSLQLQFLSQPILSTSCFLWWVTVVPPPVVITLKWLENKFSGRKESNRIRFISWKFLLLLLQTHTRVSRTLTYKCVLSVCEKVNENTGKILPLCCSLWKGITTVNHQHSSHAGLVCMRDVTLCILFLYNYIASIGQL